MAAGNSAQDSGRFRIISTALGPRIAGRRGVPPARKPKRKAHLSTFERYGVFPFLQLPGEIRKIIYEYVFSEQKWNSIERRIMRAPKKALSLLYTCRLVHAETADLPFKLGTFVCGPGGLATLRRWARHHLKPHQVDKIAIVQCRGPRLERLADKFFKQGSLQVPDDLWGMAATKFPGLRQLHMEHIKLSTPREAEMYARTLAMVKQKVAEANPGVRVTAEFVESWSVHRAISCGAMRRR